MQTDTCFGEQCFVAFLRWLRRRSWRERVNKAKADILFRERDTPMGADEYTPKLSDKRKGCPWIQASARPSDCNFMIMES